MKSTRYELVPLTAKDEKTGEFFFNYTKNLYQFEFYSPV